MIFYCDNNGAKELKDIEKLIADVQAEHNKVNTPQANSLYTQAKTALGI